MCLSGYLTTLCLYVSLNLMSDVNVLTLDAERQRERERERDVNLLYNKENLSSGFGASGLINSWGPVLEPHSFGLHVVWSSRVL